MAIDNKLGLWRNNDEPLNETSLNIIEEKLHYALGEIEKGASFTSFKMEEEPITVTYADNEGATVIGKAKINDDSECDFEFILPILHGEDITIDANDAGNALIIKSAETVTISAPSGATNGTLTTAQLAQLRANKRNVIDLQRDPQHNEFFTLETDNEKSGSLCYTNTEYENNVHIIKTITITVSTRAWVLHEVEVKETTSYTIKVTTNCDADSGNATSIMQGGMALLLFSDKINLDEEYQQLSYLLPDEVTVTGAKYKWDKDEGELFIYNPTSNVTVNVQGTEAWGANLKLTGCTKVSGPDAVVEGGSATFVVKANDGYTLPDSITVASCTLDSYDASTGTIKISNVTQSQYYYAMFVITVKALKAFKFESGLYTWPKPVSFPTTAVIQNVSFKSGADQTSYTQLTASASDIQYGSTSVVTSKVINQGYEFLKIEAEQNMGSAFATQLITTNKLMRMPIGSWTFAKGTPLRTNGYTLGTYDGKFELSDGTPCKQIVISTNMLGETIDYITETNDVINAYYGSANYGQVWDKDAYRTIIFTEEPSGAMLTMLNNAAAQNQTLVAKNDGVVYPVTYDIVGVTFNTALSTNILPGSMCNSDIIAAVGTIDSGYTVDYEQITVTNARLITGGKQGGSTFTLYITKPTGPVTVKIAGIQNS